MPDSGAPQTDLDPWAVGNYGAGAFTWSSTARRVITGITAFAAAGLTPNAKTDAQSFNEWLARVEEWIRFFRGETTAGTDGMLSAIYGDGSDGDVVIGSSGSLARTMYYRNLTVPNTFVVNTAGYIIFVADTLTVEAGGRISYNGGNASGGTGGSGAPSTLLLGGTAGANGVSNGSGQNGAAGTSQTRAIGGSGGKGGDVDGGTFVGANGGTATNPAATDGGWRDLYSAQGANAAGDKWRAGCGGGSGATLDGNGTSGGGGGGGGPVIIFARRIDNQGTIQAAGGNGGNANDNSTSTEIAGGGGGGGGFVYLVHREAVGGSVGTVEAPGGTGGLGDGTVTTGESGVNGSAGTVTTLVG